MKIIIPTKFTYMKITGLYIYIILPQQYNNINYIRSESIIYVDTRHR